MPAQAAELGELQVTELPEGGPAFIVREPTQAVLVVQTSVVPLSFESNMGIIRVDNPSRGEYRLILNAGTNMVVFKNNDYQPLRERFYIPAKSAIVVKVEVKKAALNEGGRGSMTIATTPSAANVSLDGLPSPNLTPLTIEHQLVGVHSLHVAKTGYRDLDTTVRIERDQTTTVSLTLGKLIAALKVTSNPSGATVILDGDEIGATPLDRNDLTPGEGTLVVSLKGYETVTRQVRLASDTPKTESIDLFAQTGSVSITCDPTDATVFLDGASVGTFTGSPITREKLSLGRHTIRATLDGYEDANTTFNVEYNKATPVKLTLAPKPGAIYVMTTPEGADISLDGKPTGKKTGWKFENVASGSHQLRLSLTGYGDVEKSLTVRPGKTETISEAMSATPKFDPGNTGVFAKNAVKEQSLDPLSGMTFVSIPAGSFMMGSNDGDGDEKPVHPVEIRPFRMMTTEVTQKMWVEVMGSNPSNFKGDDLPVEQVSWNDCQDFIKKLNQRDPGKGYRLPSEAEWEYACRAGTTTTYNLGDSESDLGRGAWHNSNSGSKTHPVGQKTPNTWGLYDLHGNVWELCEDWYHGSYTGAPSDGSAWVAGGGTSRVLRGGYWGSLGRFGVRRCRSSDRFDGLPDARYFTFGFRVVASFPSP